MQSLFIRTHLHLFIVALPTLKSCFSNPTRDDNSGVVTGTLVTLTVYKFESFPAHIQQPRLPCLDHPNTSSNQSPDCRKCVKYTASPTTNVATTSKKKSTEEVVPSPSSSAAAIKNVSRKQANASVPSARKASNSLLLVSYTKSCQFPHSFHYIVD